MNIKKDYFTSGVVNLASIKKKKIWRYKKDGQVSSFFSELEFIDLIIKKEIDKDTLITNTDLKKWIALDKTIYRFYLK